MEVEAEPMSKSNSLIKLQRTTSLQEQDPSKITSEVQKLILEGDYEVQEQAGPAVKQDILPLLIQMPSNLPFEVPADQSELLKLGKLRFHKSGKVTLRIQKETNGKLSKIDLLVNKGISNSFY